MRDAACPISTGKTRRVHLVRGARRLGNLCLTDQGLFDRDLYVMRAALAMGVPVATVIGGGYDADHECAPSPLPAHGASAAIASPAGALLDL